MNAVRGRLAGASAFFSNTVGPYKSTLTLLIYMIISAVILYQAFTFLFPAPDKFEQVIVNKSVPANALKGQQIKLYPPMVTGGEYSFQTWFYINDLDFKPGTPKHLFTIASDGQSGSNPPHVTMLGVLDANSNKLILRVHQDTTTFNSAGTGPDLTLNSNITNLFTGTLKADAGQGPDGMPICDIGNIEAQRWCCLSVVVNGRMIDVYIDGKMARSCVCPGIPVVNPGNNFLTMGLQNGWGGSVSTTRFYGYALTPAKVYELYQEGPAPSPNAQKGFFASLLSKIGITTDIVPAVSVPPAPVTNKPASSSWF
jgi:hypothetical protein